MQENPMPNPAPVNAAPVNAAPITPLHTDYKLWKLIVFGILTFGIYDIVIFTSMANALNTACGNQNEPRTMHFCLLIFLIAPITMGIGALVWYHRFSARVGRELARRGITNIQFGAGTYWGWAFLGSFIVVGPFIYCYKLMEAMNAIDADYNARG